MSCCFVILVCKIMNETDNFIRCKTLANIDKKLSNIDVTESLKSMERRLTDLVDQKIGNAMKTTCDKVEKTYSAVVAAETTTRINQAQTTQHAARSNSDHNINQSF